MIISKSEKINFFVRRVNLVGIKRTKFRNVTLLNIPKSDLKSSPK